MDVFLYKNNELLKKYNNIWNKASHSIKKYLIVKPFAIKIFLKFFEVTNIHDKEMTKVGSNFFCLAVILIDFVLKKVVKLLSTSFFKIM